MPYKNNLRIIMARKRINGVSDLMRMTGLSRNALNRLWHDEQIDSIKLGTLVIICDSLNIKLSELIEYVPEKHS